jgi:hypothetical protein
MEESGRCKGVREAARCGARWPREARVGALGAGCAYGVAGLASPSHGIERVDHAAGEAEVADQQVTVQRTEAGGGEREAPGRRERSAAHEALQEASVLVEDIDEALAGGRGPLCRETVRNTIR